MAMGVMGSTVLFLKVLVGSVLICCITAVGGVMGSTVLFLYY
jgi:hypothetical protein